MEKQPHYRLTSPLLSVSFVGKGVMFHCVGHVAILLVMKHLLTSHLLSPTCFWDD
jgi:hypothetical protein